MTPDIGPEKLTPRFLYEANTDQGSGLPKSGDQDQRNKDKDRFERDMRGLIERSPYTEMITEGDMWQVRHAMRITAHGFETEAILDFMNRPDTYWAGIRMSELRERAKALRYTYPRWPTEMRRFVKEDQVVEKESTRTGFVEDRKERQALAQAVEGAYNELKARKSLIDQLGTQEAFSGDVGTYLDELFTRVGVETIAAKHYEHIFAAPETEKGFVPFGEKVDEVIRSLREVAEGRAKVTIDGKTVRVPNIFAMPPNRSVQEFVINEVVTKSLEGLRASVGDRPSELDSNPDMKDYENFDDYMATILGIAVWRHWDYEVKHAFGAGPGSILEGEIDSADFSGIGLETSTAGKDSAKMYIEFRRHGEWGWAQDKDTGKWKRREHPRPAGNPMTLGCYPSMFAAAPEIIQTEMKVTDSMREEANRVAAAFYEEKGIPVDKRKGVKFFVVGGDTSDSRVATTVHDFVFEDKPYVGISIGYEKEEDLEVVDAQGVRSRQRKTVSKKEGKYIQVNRAHGKFSEVNWDGAVAYVTDPKTPDDEDAKWVQFVTGPQSDAYRLPYQLMMYYLFKGIYREVMREDFLKQYAEATATGDANLLFRMNKPIDVGLVLLAIKHHLPSETWQKLGNLIRANFLGSLIAQQVLKLDQKQLEGRMVSQHARGIHADQAIAFGLEAARVHSFLPVKEDGNLDNKWEALTKSIATNRKGVRPSEARYYDTNNQQKPLFTKEELDLLKPLYPLGV